ncbi:MAG: winged helix DNA-binding domain-containing protein, partial [Bdellovibrio sp.]|nr:winged helix DNA-binding domain-containing protein [Bdellovibrio sp.]
YELVDRHFDWDQKPKAATEKECNAYLLDRALKSQALVSLASICHLEPKKKIEIQKLIDNEVKSKNLIEVQIENGADTKKKLWMKPDRLDRQIEIDTDQVHILSPFDPLIIQRKRLNHFFDYDHKFEAYIPKEKRIYGYFALPVMIGNKIVAAIDLKTDRPNNKLLIQKWTWIGKEKSIEKKKLIEQELSRFEKFQLRK